MGSVSPEKIISDVQNLEIVWKKHGSLAGHEVSTLGVSAHVEVRKIQEEAKELFRSLQDIEQHGATEEQLVGLREAQKKIATLYQASTEALLTVGTDQLFMDTASMAYMSIPEIEDLYNICLGLKRDLEEAKGLLRDQGTQSLLQFDSLVSWSLDTIKSELVSRKEDENNRASGGTVSSPKTLAKEGKETMLAGYIRTGGELQRLEGVEPAYGPVNISPETKILNKMITALLLDMNAVRFTQDPSGVVMATFDGTTYNFSDIIAKANFNHLNLEFEDEQDKNRFLDRYHELQTKGVFKFPPMEGIGGNSQTTPEYFDRQDPDGVYKNLTLAEKEAINVYTGEANWFMIRLLRGNFAGIVEAFDAKVEIPYPSDFPKDQKFDAVVKEGLIHCAVCTFGLNKLQDYIPPPRPDGSIPQYLYRNEKLSEDDIRRRNQLVATGGVSTVADLMSTSHTNAVYWSGNVYLLVINAKGKAVEILSQHRYEQEILLPPTQMQWLYHAEDTSNKTHFYIVRPITSSAETPI